MWYDGLAKKNYAAKTQLYRFGVLSPDKRRGRLILVGGLAGLWIIALIWRLVSLQVTNFETWQQWGLKQHLATIKLASERGPLYDRFGRLLAVSVPTGSVYVRPAQVSQKRDAAAKLSALLELDSADIMEKLDRRQPFVWLKRQVPRQLAEKVSDLNIPGVSYVIESRRYYPYNQAASALIGKVGIDGDGLSGIEMLFDSHLRGEQKETFSIRDARGNLIQTSVGGPAGLELPKGDSLKLTLDAEIQTIVDEELEAARQSANAKSTMAVMVDSETGEILAMGQAPGFNFNSDKSIPSQALRNLAVETIFEPGSIMKPLVAAAAIDAGLINPSGMLNCENGRYRVGSHTIKDVHPSGVISLHDVVVRSSNIGMTKVGFLLGKERLYQALTSFGFGQNLHLGLVGETPGILRNVSSWAQVDVATHAFGQGVAVTPLQVVRAMSAIANGGVLPTLSFIYHDQPSQGQRLLSPTTAREVQDMMYGVVEDDHGTGQKGEIEGVRVGGKTGTAQKARENGRGYEPGAYVASFVGFVDASSIGINKTLTLIVVVDEPHAKSIYGGTLAAPVFRRIMQRSLHVLSAEGALLDKKGAVSALQQARTAEYSEIAQKG